MFAGQPCSNDRNTFVAVALSSRFPFWVWLCPPCPRCPHCPLRPGCPRHNSLLYIGTCFHLQNGRSTHPISIPIEISIPSQVKSPDPTHTHKPYPTLINQSTNRHQDYSQDVYHLSPHSRGVPRATILIPRRSLQHHRRRHHLLHYLNGRSR